jgi:ribose transport system ATP-binding protein
VRAGEILGIAGLLGSGRTELLETLFGHRRMTGGRVTLDGTPYAPRRPHDALARGVAFVPENRARDGAFLDLSVADNVAMASLRRFHRGCRRRPGEERAAARDAIARYAIRTPDETVPLTSLSGGNQQKAVLARSLLRDPRLLLLDEPTQGIDAAARQDIYRTIRARAADGAAAIVVSSDLEELVRECDRIVVVRAGRTVAEVERADFDVHRLTALAATDQPAWEDA